MQFKDISITKWGKIDGVESEGMSMGPRPGHTSPSVTSQGASNAKIEM